MSVESQLETMCEALGKRGKRERVLKRYYRGDAPIPQAIQNARVTNAYRMLVGLSTAPWAGLVVDEVASRLQVVGLDTGEDSQDETLWDFWRDADLDDESKLAHKASLISGRSFAIVWPDVKTGQPTVSLETPSQVIVRYAEGSRRERVAALRYWVDDADNRPRANLMLPDGIYKFVGSKDSYGPSGLTWRRREEPGEDWPVSNPWGVVPAVELPVNRELEPGSWGYARGEFEHVTSLIDRINLLTFLGLVIAFWQGFPIRAIVGDKILRDDDGKPLPPFEVGADGVAQFEDPQTRLEQFPAADRSNLSIYAELDQLAALTKTPLTAFPSSTSGGGISNISADTIRALEGGLVAKIPGHQASLGGGWTEVLRLAGMMLDDPIELGPRAELRWGDPENRSMAERADAALKLKDIIPNAALIEFVLNASAEQMARWSAMGKADDVMTTLLAAAAQPTPVPGAAPAAPSSNGGG